MNTAISLSEFTTSIPVVEVFPEVRNRNIRAKDGTERRLMYQVGIAHLRGRLGTPETREVQVDVNDGEVYTAGFYTFNAASFLVNNYGSMEMRKYGTSLIKLPSELEELFLKN